MAGKQEKSSNRAEKGGFLGGVLRVSEGYFFFCAVTLGNIHHHPPSPPLVTHQSLLCGYRCLVAMTPPGCITTTTREHGDIAKESE